MKTDDLIASLVADHPSRMQPVWLWLLAGLFAALPLSAAIFMMSFRMRPDLASAIYNPFFDFKFVVMLVLASVSAALSLHLSRPGASLERWGWLLAVPAGLLGIAIVADFAVPQRNSWTARLVGSSAMACMASIPLFAVPFLAAALWTLRRGATTRPMLVGALAGLMSAGLGGAIYAVHCMDDSPLFVATWYTLAAVLVAAVGAFAGKRVLRF